MSPEALEQELLTALSAEVQTSRLAFGMYTQSVTQAGPLRIVLCRLKSAGAHSLQNKVTALYSNLSWQGHWV